MRRWWNSRGEWCDEREGFKFKRAIALWRHKSPWKRTHALFSSRMTTCPTKEDDDKKCAVVLFPADDYLSLYFSAAYLSASSFGDATRMEYWWCPIIIEWTRRCKWWLFMLGSFESNSGNCSFVRRKHKVSNWLMATLWCKQEDEEAFVLVSIAIGGFR